MFWLLLNIAIPGRTSDFGFSFHDEINFIFPYRGERFL